MIQLDQFTFNELQDWLSDHLQLHGQATASINRRRHESAYEFPLNSWNSGDDAFRNRFERAINQLLKNCKQIPWKPDHFHNLAMLIEKGRIKSAIHVLQEIAHSHCWLRLDNGLLLHMLILRTLLGLGDIRNTDFWVEEGRMLQGQYPELIFRGLLAHGLSEAFSRLDQVANDTESVKRILGLFPDLIDKHGLETIVQHVMGALSHVTNDVSDEIRNWFPQWEYKI